LPSEGQSAENLHKATIPKKVHLKNNQVDQSVNEINKLSVKATLFDEGTLKNLLKEKSTLSQLEQSFREENDDDDDFLVPNKAAIVRSKRLQNKRKRRDREKEETKTKKMSKSENEQNESLGNDKDKDVFDEEGEKRCEIEGLYYVYREYGYNVAQLPCSNLPNLN
jgi:hypothetical protein